MSLRLFDYNPQTVIPAQAGIQARRNQFKTLDSRFPGMTEKLALFSFDFKFLLIFYPIFALIKGGLRVAPDLLEFPSVLMPLTLAPDVYGKLWRSFRGSRNSVISVLNILDPGFHQGDGAGKANFIKLTSLDKPFNRLKFSFQVPRIWRYHSQ